MKENKPSNCNDFKEWLDLFIYFGELKLSLKTIELMKMAWDAGVENAALWAEYMEGTSYDVRQLKNY